MSAAVKILAIPSNALVVLVGAAGAGKSTFANAHFQATEILSSDFFRALVSDDAGSQEATADAFDLLHSVLAKRLRRGKLCVVDATNVSAEHRARLVEQARRFARPAIAIVFDTPAELCVARAAGRSDRIVRADIVSQQLANLNRGFDGGVEGFSQVFRLNPTDRIGIQRTISYSS